MSTDFKTDSSYILIKGRFKATSASAYGLFIIFMDNISKNVEKLDLVASHFSTIHDNNNPTMPWNELEEMIIRMKWKGEYATSLTHDIQATVDDLFQPNTGRGADVWAAIKKGQFNKVQNIFDEYLVRPTGDKNIKTELAIETVTKSDIEDARRARDLRDGKEVSKIGQSATPVPKQENEFGLEDNAVVLDVNLVLSPVSGRPIYELREGDKVLIKISEESGRGQYFIDLLGASRDNEVLPVPATIISVTKDGKIYTVLMNIGPGIYGKSMDEDTVKVKLYDPVLDKDRIAPPLKKAETVQPAISMPTQAASSSDADKKNDPMNLMFIVIGVVAVVLLIVVVMMMM